MRARAVAVMVEWMCEYIFFIPMLEYWMLNAAKAIVFQLPVLIFSAIDEISF